MSNVVTKVKAKGATCQENSRQKSWESVLEDIQGRIAELKRLVPIVERKIKRKEAWP